MGSHLSLQRVPVPQAPVKVAAESRPKESNPNPEHLKAAGERRSRLKGPNPNLERVASSSREGDRLLLRDLRLVPHPLPAEGHPRRPRATLQTRAELREFRRTMRRGPRRTTCI